MDATTLLSSQLGAAAASAYILNWMKDSAKIPWISAHTTQINKLVRAGMAIAATIGISFAWNPTEGTLLISGVHLVTILQGGWHAFQQYAYTHWIGAALEAKAGPPTTP